MKYDVVDGSTAFHFGIGAAAGVSGMDPKVVLLVALFADATWEIIRAKSAKAAFEAGHGSSKAKEIVNLLAIIGGAHLGKLVKERAAPAAAPVSSPPTVPPAAPDVAGFGRVW